MMVHAAASAAPPSPQGDMTLGGLRKDGLPPELQSWQRYGTDDCSRLVREQQNAKIGGERLYNPYMEPVACEASALTGGMRSPGFAYEHPSLRVQKIGYGVADACVIDTYSRLRQDPGQMTNDGCRIQLKSRMFAHGPSYRPGGDVDESSRLFPSVDSSLFTPAGRCVPRKALMEMDYRRQTPMVPRLRREMADPGTVVGPWTRGGEMTRRAEAYGAAC